ncbi:MAG: Fe-S protein assembly co-chaperone HscB [Acidiferrobacterales bacterium]
MQADLEKNFFELFGLPVSFALDTADLASRYRDLQRRFHPDRYASATDQERRLSLQITAQINQGFQTLKEPVARGRYLLALQGISTDEETDTIMDPDFLVEQMELRESLDDARRSPQRRELLSRLAQKTDGQLRARTEALGHSFADNSGAARARARELIREMQFLKKLASEIEELDETG